MIFFILENESEFKRCWGRERKQVKRKKKQKEREKERRTYFHSQDTANDLHKHQFLF